MNETISNQRLEHEIAMYYLDYHRLAPGVTPKETGILGTMWNEFDRRAEAGTIDDE